jgi:hypothetical protein
VPNAAPLPSVPFSVNSENLFHISIALAVNLA